jgi:hypothetical protein
LQVDDQTTSQTPTYEPDQIAAMEQELISIRAELMGKTHDNSKIMNELQFSQQGY